MGYLKAESLTNESIRGLGYHINSKIDTPVVENDSISYYNILSDFSLSKNINIGIVEGHNEEEIVKSVERHSNSSEILVALQGDAIVLLGKDNIFKDSGACKAFFIKQGDALILNPGVWHSTPVPVNKQCRFLVIFASGTFEKDLEVKDLPEEVRFLNS